jgi:hypothetical protein
MMVKRFLAVDIFIAVREFKFVYKDYSIGLPLCGV